ncbi:unnamed protein product [Staurois parvus]|uniref:Uncharacterized protein n=1 Tax=Staurois parvus TaxID=386267 RepID=A0ABN9ERJ3_9NEOB|nr:unnamed protein product [Staurois parvus]
MLFDPDFSDPFLPVSPCYLLIRPISCGVTLHMINLVCIARGFFSWESAYDQHKANEHCPNRGQEFCSLIEQLGVNENFHKL